VYYYIFDPPTGPNDYQRIAQIKEKLTALGIAGEMASPMPGKTVVDLVENAVAKRYATIVAVGDMLLINQVAQALEPHDVVLGIIPLHEQPDITSLIGAPTWEQAAEHLKRRRWQPVRLGLIKGSSCFLTPATIVVPPTVTVECITPQFHMKYLGGTLSIAPGRATEESDTMLAVQVQWNEKPRSGFFGNLFGSAPSSDKELTRFFTPMLRVKTEQALPVIVAGIELGQTPLECTMQPKPVRLIVAKRGS
jgi:hypothetical protein